MNQQPYKICPRCRAAAHTQAVHCELCGWAFATTQPPHQRPAERRPSRQQQKTSPMVWLVAGLSALTLLGFALLSLTTSAPASRPVLETKAPLNYTEQNPLLNPGMDVPPPDAEPLSARSGLGGSPVQDGIFKRSPSRLETPTINVTNADHDILTVELQHVDGRRYRMMCNGRESRSIQVPAGDYRIVVSSSDPDNAGNEGTAVFRRYSQYSATFIAVPAHMARPLRLGDL